jgi:hypothetical protein
MPRTPSPAAATGLPETTLSRRAMLGRIPAAALATTAILPAVTDASPLHDAELLALGDEMEANHAVTIAAVGDNAVDACVTVEDGLAHKIVQVPARSIAGLKAKARALFIVGDLNDGQWNRPETWTYEDPKDGLVLSLMEDIFAMEV